MLSKYVFVVLCFFGGDVIIRSGLVTFIYTYSSNYFYSIGTISEVMLKDMRKIDLYKTHKA